MSTQGRAQAVFLKDYVAPNFAHLETRLEFFLHPERTKVVTELDMKLKQRGDLTLNGRDLKLLSIEIDNHALTNNDYQVKDELLIIKDSAIPAQRFTLKTQVEINPSANTSLDGLYISNGMYCTQCEAEGFRKITFYPDRPDVMTTFRVKIHSDLPVRLSNGNPLTNSEGQSEWHDPWPKPCYLFALVAGDLLSIEDHFTTQSGRDVTLKIFVRRGDETRCHYAMDALKRAMRWDEEEYGREYDLDLFMIVAVDDFNMGAMENKGLNIFNSRLVLASPETATDADYAAIESVIAHEYFHNWTGNRITCRDWFQLSLKEGLTVFRDQQFSQHERSEAVQRIDDVGALRVRQFVEDASPLSHPVRPEKYAEINNFYTATIYEKGAELIRMLKGLVGAENYRKALDLYFERHDGQACTIEDWLKVFEDATGRDLAQFKHWYEQAGTPIVKARTESSENAIKLTLEQSFMDSFKQTSRPNMHIPLKFSIIGENGDVFDEGQIELTSKTAELTFQAPSGAKISLNQGFSAPIILKQENFDPSFFARHDNDPFNRFEAIQNLSIMALTAQASVSELTQVFSEIINEEDLEPALKAQYLTLPDFNMIHSANKYASRVSDPDEIMQKIDALEHEVAKTNLTSIKSIYRKFCDLNTRDISPEMAGRRALANKALAYITAIEEDAESARVHFEEATLMTDKIAALTLLVSKDRGEDALAKFYDQYRDERLLIDKWFAIQATYSSSKSALTIVQNLSKHADFQNPTPNRWRALMGGFAMNNPAAFHQSDGSGYAFYANALIEQDKKNPQITARMSTAFQTCGDFGEARKELAKKALNLILGTPNLSKNLSEMISRMKID